MPFDMTRTLAELRAETPTALIVQSWLTDSRDTGTAWTHDEALAWISWLADHLDEDEPALLQAIQNHPLPTAAAQHMTVWLQHSVNALRPRIAPRLFDGLAALAGWTREEARAHSTEALLRAVPESARTFAFLYQTLGLWINEARMIFCTWGIEDALAAIDRGDAGEAERLLIKADLPPRSARSVAYSLVLGRQREQPPSPEQATSGRALVMALYLSVGWQLARIHHQGFDALVSEVASRKSRRWLAVTVCDHMGWTEDRAMRDVEQLRREHARRRLTGCWDAIDRGDADRATAELTVHAHMDPTHARDLATALVQGLAAPGVARSTPNTGAEEGS